MPSQPDTLHIHLPDTFTVGMWQTYSEAQRAYEHALPDDKRPGSPLLARYHGALGLIRAGYVHIDGPDEVRGWLQQNDQSLTPLPVVGLIVRYVALPIEEALEQATNTDFLSKG